MRAYVHVCHTTSIEVREQPLGGGGSVLCYEFKGLNLGGEAGRENAFTC